MSQTTTPTGPTTGHRDESSVRQEALVADHSIEVSGAQPPKMATPPCSAAQGSRQDTPEEAAVQTTQQAASPFLSNKRIAVTGVSRSAPQNHGANTMLNRLRDRGYDVFPVNPNTSRSKA